MTSVVSASALSPSREVFYTTAATVLPILILAIAVQFRAYDVFLQGLPRSELRKRALKRAPRFAGAVFLLLASSELLALLALYRNQDEIPFWILLNLILGVIFVFSGAVVTAGGQLREVAQASDSQDRTTKGSSRAPETGVAARLATLALVYAVAREARSRRRR